MTEDAILFGMTGPFSGSAAELGRGMQAGITTYFDHVNSEGGIAGRKLSLRVLDDGYEPDRALANVRRLIEEDGVFGFVGNVGTPTSEKVLPYILEKQVLLFGCFAGSLGLRKVPPDRYVFNYRPSLPEETAAAVRYLLTVKNVRPDQIAVFSQGDAYGAAGFAGVERECKHGRSAEQIVHVRYQRNTMLIEPAAKEILRGRT